MGQDDVLPSSRPRRAARRFRPSRFMPSGGERLAPLLVRRLGVNSFSSTDRTGSGIERVQ